MITFKFFHFSNKNIVRIFLSSSSSDHNLVGHNRKITSHSLFSPCSPTLGINTLLPSERQYEYKQLPRADELKLMCGALLQHIKR